MKKIKIVKIAFVMSILLTTAACGADAEKDRTIIKEPGKIITVIDGTEEEAEKPGVTVGKIDRLENMAIMGWLDEETVVVSRENTSLEKMTLLELSDSYPKSLYLYNINTGEFNLLKEKENTHLGEAVLSPDKKHLIYSEYDLGDPVYYVMDMATQKAFAITGNGIGGAVSAKWADNETVIGASYSGGAYTASVTGEIKAIEELDGTAPVIIAKIKNKIYFNTQYDETLWVLDLDTNEKVSLNLEHVYNVLPSPDGNQMLVIKSSGSKTLLLLCDTQGANGKTLAEGAEIGGISWSADQRMIAYSLKADVNGVTVNNLYLYDMLTGESVQIAVNVGNPVTSWSPAGEKLVYTQFNTSGSVSNIVYLQLAPGN